MQVSQRTQGPVPKFVERKLSQRSSRLFRFLAAAGSASFHHSRNYEVNSGEGVGDAQQKREAPYCSGTRTPLAWNHLDGGSWCVCAGGGEAYRKLTSMITRIVRCIFLNSQHGGRMGGKPSSLNSRKSYHLAMKRSVHFLPFGRYSL